MERVRYVHAADLHLDTPFRGLSSLPGAEQALTNATFAALDSLAALCERERPDFLVLAGDIYDQEERSIRAQLALRDFCARLAASGIRVFITHGNHDPLSSRLDAINWPENTVVFGSEPASSPVESNGETIALVHGASHAQNPENRNLAQLFRRREDLDCFQIGVLHCNVDGAVSEDRYAPCSLEDLLKTGLDAWALGHAHARRVLNEQPFIAYSGNTQGLSPNEGAPRGCYLVDAERRDGAWNCAAEFFELGPVSWQAREISLENMDALDAARDAMRDCVEETREAGKDVILTLSLTGCTALDATLRKPGSLQTLLSELNEHGEATPAVWIRKIELNTRPYRSEAELLDRDDLLGQLSRLAKDLREHPEALDEVAASAFEPLQKSRHNLAGTQAMPDADGLKDLLARALRICETALERP